MKDLMCKVGDSKNSGEITFGIAENKSAGKLFSCLTITPPHLIWVFPK